MRHEETAATTKSRHTSLLAITLLALQMVLPVPAVAAQSEVLSGTHETSHDMATAANAGEATRAADGDSIQIRFYDVELGVVVQALGRYLDRPVVVMVPPGRRVTLETPRPVARSAVQPLLRELVESHGLLLVGDSSASLYRVEAPKPATALPETRRTTAALGGQHGLHIIRLRHARAADVAATVNALYGRGTAFGEPGASPLSRDASVPVVAPLADAPPEHLRGGVPLGHSQGAGQEPSARGGPRRIAQLSGEVTIVPDPNSNALLVRAAQDDYLLIEEAVAALDIRPLQVLVEIIIAEVRRDRNFSFGIEGKIPEQTVPGQSGLRAAAGLAGIGLGDFALSVLYDGPGLDFEAVLRASAARGDAKILSRPVVLATNGETAQILVGSQRPFVQVQRSLPTETAVRDQVVQYRDVGTRLTVRPTISADSYVSLALTQEVNAATTETQFDAPVISTRSVQTVLLVRDSQTVVLGGLSDEQRERTQSGVPLLSAIPWIGGFFGKASSRRAETEFFLFLRPRIIRSDEDAGDVTTPYQRKAEQVRQ